MVEIRVCQELAISYSHIIIFKWDMKQTILHRKKKQEKERNSEENWVWKMRKACKGPLPSQPMISSKMYNTWNQIKHAWQTVKLRKMEIEMAGLVVVQSQLLVAFSSDVWACLS